MKNKLPVTEELDFHYLLGLMPPLHDEPEFAWLPELFSIIGHESLIELCKYAGGETIRIPTLEQLSNSIQALQLFYDIDIKHIKSVDTIPSNTDVFELFYKIRKIYNARNS
jgi:hypothetical protein